MDLLYDRAIPFLGIYSKECDWGYSKGTCTPMFIAALFTIIKLWKQPRYPITDEWIRKCGIYTQWNFTQSQRRIILSEVSQAQKAKNLMFLLICWL
jgi:hypothetical protein